MKQFYTIFIALVLSFTGFSQNYQFGIVHNTGYNFSVVATPNFDVTDSDVSDIGFALMLPAGDANVTNVTTFEGRLWSATEVTAAQFTNVGIDSEGRDGFAMNLPPGQTILSHTMNTPFVLVSFDISNMPTTGDMEILDNSDPIAIALGGAVDSFYNSNIDGTTTQNYFGGLMPGQDSFSFDTLSVEQVLLEDVDISIYPNPSSDVMTISTNLVVTELILFDILGKKVLTLENSKIFKVNKLNAGVYMLKIKTTKGSLTKKVVVE